jgi:hypothetical protein
MSDSAKTPNEKKPFGWQEIVGGGAVGLMTAKVGATIAKLAGGTSEIMANGAKAREAIKTVSKRAAENIDNIYDAAAEATKAQASAQKAATDTAFQQMNAALDAGNPDQSVKIFENLIDSGKHQLANLSESVKANEQAQKVLEQAAATQKAIGTGQDHFNQRVKEAFSQAAPLSGKHKLVIGGVAIVATVLAAHLINSVRNKQQETETPSNHIEAESVKKDGRIQLTQGRLHGNALG